MRRLRVSAVTVAALLLAACAGPQRPATPVAVVPPVVSQDTAKPAVPDVKWKRVAWSDVPSGWQMAGSAAAWQTGCRVLAADSQWAALCQADQSALNDVNWWQSQFDVYQVSTTDGNVSGMLTGYYEPYLSGSLSRTSRFNYPVYGVPADLLTLDMSALYPELKGSRVRGRVEGKRVLPYWSREAIEAGKLPADTPVLAWVDDPVALFFLQVQGSGRIRLADGRQVRLGYADQNGYPYQSIGRELIRRGELTLDQASMQGIQAWAKRNPSRLQGLLNVNPSYVFFRQLPDSNEGPIGSLNVPLTEGYSIAVDTRSVPLGAPVLLETQLPDSTQAARRLVMAQDTGGAIRGAVRADLFTGLGDAAGQLAGRMRQPLKYWVLWPKGKPLPAEMPR